MFNKKGLSQEDIQLEYDSIKKKADSISAELKTEVEYFTFPEVLDNGEETGVVYVAFAMKPNIMAAAMAMDMILSGKVFEAGLKIWSACYLSKYSDSEIETNQKYKLGLSSKFGTLLDVQIPEIKKN